MITKKNITGLQHVGIPTNDIDKTTSFYEGLGFKMVYKTINQAANEKVVFLQLGNLIIETYENKAAKLETGSIDHISLNVTDIDSIFQEIKKGDYDMLDETIQTLPFWENGVKFFTILGPNKEKIEFCERVA